METYTKEQLIAAMVKYNEAVNAHPENFSSLQEDDDLEIVALAQIECLLEFVE